ncbi:MAG: hypothetical protein HY263_07915 [Chloroflexi bacterium]|nr:hypothetical protein [Chloroflexota bacterium]
MHPRTREVRKPDSGIDPRGSGSGQPPLLQGFLKRRKPAGHPGVPAPGASEPTSTPATDATASPAPPAPKRRKGTSTA